MTNQRPFAVTSVLAFLLFAFSLLPSAFAQSATATLSGTVEDQNGAVVPGVNITLTNTANGQQRQTTTDDNGSYTIPLLSPGTYILRAERQGFAPIETRNIVLNVGDRKALQVQLKAGDINAQVQVTNEAPLINESPAVATTIDRTFVANLPLNGRSFQSLILLTPGIVQTRSQSGRVGQFSVNGQRANANYFTLDGVGSNAGFSFSGGGFTTNGTSQQLAGTVPGLSAAGTTSTIVSIDALEEFKIQTSTYGAEFGRQPGAQVQLVSRSGSNDFHGTVFEYLRNEAFDANDWFANRSGLRRAPLRQNQFGGTFSGPLPFFNIGEGGPSFSKGKDRTFFFFSYEGLRLRLPVTANFMVPSLRARQIAAAALKPFLNMYPVPTGPETKNTSGVPTGYAPFVGSYSNPSTTDATSVRIDHKVNEKLTLFGRYNFAPSSSRIRTLMTLSGDVNRVHSLTLGATSAFRSITNELRVNWSKSSNATNSSMDSFGGAVPIDLATITLGYSGPGVKQGAFQYFLPGGGIGTSLGDQQSSYQQQMNIVDNMAWTNGAHYLRFGFDYRRLAPTYGPRAFFAQLRVSNETQLMNGTLANLQKQAGIEVRPRFNSYSLYFADQWKFSERLNIDMGVRWEVNPAPHDANGLKPVLVVFNGADDLSSAKLAPSERSFYKTDFTAFAPRMGMAYAFNRANGKETVLRAGFGVYYDLGNGQATNAFLNFPYVAFSSQNNVPFPVSAAQAQPPAFTTITLPTTQVLQGMNPSLKLPYTLGWSMGIERALGQDQVVSVAYVGSSGRRLLTTTVLNRPMLRNGVLFRPNPNFGPVNYTDNGPTSDYHSLQAQFRRRLSRGLQVIANYTFSRAIDEASDEFQEAAGKTDRGYADFDVRHNFSAGVTYVLPKLKGRSILASLVNDWALDSTMYIQSGSPLSLSAGNFTREDGTYINVRPDVIPGVPFWVSDPSAPGGQRLNPAAFANPPLDIDDNPTRQGTLGRNVVRFPGRSQVNFAIRRQFSVSEKLRFQLKAEAFNLFNHPLFGSYETFIGDSAFGEATIMLNRTLGGLNSLYQMGGPRSLQFSARLSF